MILGLTRFITRQSAGIELTTLACRDINIINLNAFAHCASHPLVSRDVFEGVTRLNETITESVQYFSYKMYKARALIHLFSGFKTFINKICPLFSYLINCPH